MACVRLWGLSSYNFRYMRRDPVSMIHEYMYPSSGARDPVGNRIAVKPHLSLQPGYAAGHLVGWCQCQSSPLAPYFRPAVGQCLCLPADGGPADLRNAHKLSAIPNGVVSPYWAVPRNLNFKRRYQMTKYLPAGKKDLLEYVAVKTSEQRKEERRQKVLERGRRRRF